MRIWIHIFGSFGDMYSVVVGFRFFAEFRGSNLCSGDLGEVWVTHMIGSNKLKLWYNIKNVGQHVLI